MNTTKGSEKLNISLLCACLIGGIVGWGISEIIYNSLTEDWNPILRVGIYFGIFALFFFFFGFISEWITQHLCHHSLSAGGRIRVILLAILFAVLFAAAAMLFQFVYGARYEGGSHSADFDDYLILIDHSGSTDSSDPSDERFRAVESLIENRNRKQRVMIEVFDDEIIATMPIEEVDETIGDKVSDFYRTFDKARKGGTDIQNVLMDVLDKYTDTGKSAAVILLSDGESDVDIDEVSQAYQNRNIPIYSIAFARMSSSGSQLLTDISDKTDGLYCEIDNLSDLNGTVTKMISMTKGMSLLETRPENEENSVLYIAERVIFLFILGFLTLLLLSLLLDVKDVFFRGVLSHLLTALLGAVLMEVLSRFLGMIPVRLLMCMFFSFALVPYEEVIFDDGSFGRNPSSNMAINRGMGGSSLRDDPRRRGFDDPFAR